LKFRRKANASDEFAEVGEQGEALDASPEADDPRPGGPYDVDDLPEDGIERVDLGSLLIHPEPGRELRLQVDETTGEVQAVVLAGQDGAVELRAFAAPRHGDLWSDVRPQIAEDMVRQGGEVTEREGRFGPELVCRMTVDRGDGTTATQPSRIIGVNGSRWLLRATLLGRPAMDVEGSTDWEDTITHVAVRRGTGAMPVGDALPVVLPENARRVDPPTG
jgi:hypothetical protein